MADGKSIDVKSDASDIDVTSSPQNNKDDKTRPFNKDLLTPFEKMFLDKLDQEKAKSKQLSTDLSLRKMQNTYLKTAKEEAEAEICKLKADAYDSVMKLNQKILKLEEEILQLKTPLQDPAVEIDSYNDSHGHVADLKVTDVRERNKLDDENVRLTKDLEEVREQLSECKVQRETMQKNLDEFTSVKEVIVRHSNEKQIKITNQTVSQMLEVLLDNYKNSGFKCKGKNEEAKEENGENKYKENNKKEKEIISKEVIEDYSKAKCKMANYINEQIEQVECDGKKLSEIVEEVLSWWKQISLENSNSGDVEGRHFKSTKGAGERHQKFLEQVNRIKGDNTKLANENVKLAKNLDDVLNELEDFKKRIKDMGLDKTGLEQRETNLKLDVAKLRKECDRLDNENRELHKNIREKVNGDTLLEANDILKKLNSNLKSDNEQLQTDLEKVQAEMGEIKEKLQDLTKYEALSQADSGLIQELKPPGPTKNLGSNSILNNSAKYLEGEIKRLRNVLVTKGMEVLSLKAKISNLKHENSNVKKDLEKMTKKFSELESFLDRHRDMDDFATCDNFDCSSPRLPNVHLENILSEFNNQSPRQHASELLSPSFHLPSIKTEMRPRTQSMSYIERSRRMSTNSLYKKGYSKKYNSQTSITDNK